MRTSVLTAVLGLMFAMPLFGQIGIGASGGIHYPGISESELYKIRFRAGPGYGFFVRHDLFTLGERYVFHARYKVKFFFNDTSLPNSGSSRYKFNEFAADVWMDLLSMKKANVYAGISLNLLNVTGRQKYRSDYTGTNIMPLLLTGLEYRLTESYNLFSEVFLQVAEIDAGPEPLPIHGLGLMIGFTMFISE
jgi:hypothetical protein